MWMEILQRYDRNLRKTNQILKPRPYKSHLSGLLERKQRQRTNLEHDDLPVVSLQVERPGGGNEALSGTHDVIAPTGKGIHYRDGLGAVGQGLEL